MIMTLEDRQSELKRVQLTLPFQFIEVLDLSDMEISSANKFMTNCWKKYLKEETVSYESQQQFWKGRPEKFQDMINLLIKTLWITSRVKDNYAFVRLLPSRVQIYLKPADVQEIRKQYLISKKIMTYTKPKHDNLTKVRSETESGGTKVEYKEMGLVRKGFAKTGALPFKLATKYLAKYRKEFVSELMNGIDIKFLEDGRLSSSHKSYDYNSLVNDIMDLYIANPEAIYSLGECPSDSRGRAIYETTKKVGNIIASKLMRACVVWSPYKLEANNVDYVYRAISELVGHKGSSIADKVLAGASAYSYRKMTGKLEHNIWLDRIYDELDEYIDNPDHLWTTPAEVDVNASALTTYALVLNDKECIKWCNLSNDNDIHDPYKIDGIDRKAFKDTAMRKAYGSMQPIFKVLREKGHEIDDSTVPSINKELNTGRLQRIMDFKDFLLKNWVPKESQVISIGTDKFVVDCNKYKWSELKNEVITEVVTDKGTYTTSRKSKRVKDVKKFERFSPTLLIHNLDSQIANKVALECNCLTIHDAFISSFNEIAKIHNTYKDAIASIYSNRNNIINGFTRSIGIEAEYQSENRFEVKLSTNSLR